MTHLQRHGQTFQNTSTMVGDFCPSALLGGEKVSAGRAVSCPLGKESQAAAFRTSREGKRNSSWRPKNVMLLHLPWLQSTLISTAVCVLVTAGTDRLVPLAAEVTARAKVTNHWQHSAKPSSPAPTQTLCSASDLNNVLFFSPLFFFFNTFTGGETNGRWSCWSPWAPCQSGRTRRSRQCTNPAPQRGGEPCAGKDLQSKTC